MCLRRLQLIHHCKAELDKITETSAKANQLHLGAQAQIELRKPKKPKNDSWILKPN
jgi:hypothetical protein